MPFSIESIKTALADREGRAFDSAEKRASVALMLRTNEARRSEHVSGTEVFIIRRARNERDPWSGHMAFPGGRHEPTDTDLSFTARRETHEETGLQIASHEQLGKIDDVQGRSKGRSIGLVISCYVFGVGESGFATPALNYEVDECFWVPIEWFTDPDRQMRYQPPQPHTDEYAGVRITDDPADVVWGLTYRFMTDFHTRLGHELPATAADIRQD